MEEGGGERLPLRGGGSCRGRWQIWLKCWAFDRDARVRYRDGRSEDESGYTGRLYVNVIATTAVEGDCSLVSQPPKLPQGLDIRLHVLSR